MTARDLFHLKMGNIEIRLSRNAHVPDSASGAVAERQGVQRLLPAAVAYREEPQAQRRGHVGGGELIVNQSPAHPHGATKQAPASYPPGSVLVKSPMVGTFYCAPEPGAPVVDPHDDRDDAPNSGCD